MQVCFSFMQELNKNLFKKNDNITQIRIPEIFDTEICVHEVLLQLMNDTYERDTFQ